MKNAAILGASLVAMAVVGCTWLNAKKITLPNAAPAQKEVIMEGPSEGAQTGGALAGSGQALASEGQTKGPDGPNAPEGQMAKDTATPPPPVPVEGPKLASAGQPAGMSFRLSGTVAAPQKSMLAFRVPGFIDKALVKPGQVVKQGEVLAELDKKDYELRLQLASIRRDQAAVALATAEKDFKREKELQAAKATTALVFEKISAALEAAQLALQMADVDLQINQKAFDDTKLVAPYDCVVSQQFKFVGEQVGGASPGNVYEVYNTALPEIVLNAPENLMGKLKVGQDIQVLLPAANHAGHAKIIRLVPSISNATRTFEVVAQYAEANEKVVPGYFAEAQVSVE